MLPYTVQLWPHCSVLFPVKKQKVLHLLKQQRHGIYLNSVIRLFPWSCKSASQIFCVHQELNELTFCQAVNSGTFFSTFANISLFKWIKYLTWYDEEKPWGKTSELIVQNWCSHSTQRKRKKKALKFSTMIKPEASARISRFWHPLFSVARVLFFSI